MKLPYLWKMSSNGNIVIWRVYTEDNYEVKERFIITPVTGITKDPIVTRPSEPTEHIEKNIGRSNYKDAKTVARENAERSWTDMKEKKGYTAITDPKAIKYIVEGKLHHLRNLIFTGLGIDSIEEAKAVTKTFKIPSDYESVTDYMVDPMSPMLSQELKGNIEFPILAQTKYDGQRFLCTMIDDDIVVTTRQKKRKELIPHIAKDLKVLMKATIKIRGTLDGYFDCEAIGITDTGDHLSRQQIQSRVSRTVNKHSEADQIYFIVFDYATPGISQRSRFRFLLDLFDTKEVSSLNYIKLCNTSIVQDESELQLFHSCNIEEDYEGTILRPLEGLYLPKRCCNSLKLKDTFTEEAVIIDANSGRGSAKDCVIWVVKGIDNNMEYKAVHEASVDKRRRYYKHRDRYIGRIVVVRYYSRNDSGIPSHAIVEGFRDNMD